MTSLGRGRRKVCLTPNRSLDSTGVQLLSRREVAMGRFIGIDLHKNMIVVCILEAGSETGVTMKYGLTQLDDFIATLRPDDAVAVEVTTNTAFLVKHLKRVVSDIRVVNPYQFKVIRTSTKKTDKNDAHALAFYLSKDMLPTIRQKDERYRRIESLARTRSCLVKQRTMLFNQAHNMMCGIGYATKRYETKSIPKLRSFLDLLEDPMERVELEVIIDQIIKLNENILRLTYELETAGKSLDKFENITSIKGIGALSGTILLSVIGDIADFSSEKRLASYLGLVPRVEQSNQTVKYGAITKRGNTLGRTALVQCSLIAIRYSSYLRTFYERIKNAKGSGKAIIATSRKLLGIIYHTLKNNWVFEDFPAFVIKAA
jgi:transposase